MRLLRLVPDNTKFAFMRYRVWSFPLSGALTIASFVLFFTLGLNLGIDFTGGTMIEVRTQSRAVSTDELASIRSTLGGLSLGDVQVQVATEFSGEESIQIRVPRQGEDEASQQQVIEKVRTALGTGYEYRRVEVVGPRVSGELAQSGTIAVVAALVAILIYIWFRFEWQFAVGSIIATLHDVFLTIGMFALLRLEFSLSSIAAILTIVGYSLNDTVVVYDRIREMLRRYKQMPIGDVIDIAINQTLSRTTLTSLTTLIALFALYAFGGEVIRTFTFAMIWGVFVGTYSSIFIAAPLLIVFNLRRAPEGADKPAKAVS